MSSSKTKPKPKPKAKASAKKRAVQPEEDIFRGRAETTRAGAKGGTVKTFTNHADSVEEIVDQGEPYQAANNTVYLFKPGEDFTIQAEELSGGPGDAVGYDAELDCLFLVPASKFDLFTAVDVADDGHTHTWEPGILPGDKRIRTCSHCGLAQDISREQWDQLKAATGPTNRLAAPGRNYGG